MMWVREIGIGSIENPLIDIFRYSHHLSAWHCIEIVRRNTVLVIHRSKSLQVMDYNIHMKFQLPNQQQGAFLTVQY